MFIMFTDPYARITIEGTYSTADQMLWEPSTTEYETTAKTQDSHLLQYSEMTTSKGILSTETTEADYGNEYSEASDGTTFEHRDLSSGKFDITQPIIDRITYVHRETDPNANGELIKTSESESIKSFEMIYNEGKTESQGYNS